MSVNIFGGGRNAANHGYVGVVKDDRNLNQRIILVSNKLAQKVNKSGDTMDGDLETDIQFRVIMCFIISWCRRNG